MTSNKRCYIIYIINDSRFLLSGFIEDISKRKGKWIMIYKSPGVYEYSDGEPLLRSCPDCNSAHEHLRNTNRLHVCFECGKYWILGKYLSDMTEEELETFIITHQEELEAEYNTPVISITFQVGGL